MDDEFQTVGAATVKAFFLSSIDELTGNLSSSSLSPPTTCPIMSVVARSVRLLIFLFWNRYCIQDHGNYLGYMGGQFYYMQCQICCNNTVAPNEETPGIPNNPMNFNGTGKLLLLYCKIYDIVL